MREGGRFDNEPIIVFGTQIIRKIYSLPLQIYSEPLMLSSEPLNLKSIKKYFMSYLILKINALDYHDGCTFLLCVNSETLQKKIFLYCDAALKCKRNWLL